MVVLLQQIKVVMLVTVDTQGESSFEMLNIPYVYRVDQT